MTSDSDYPGKGLHKNGNERRQDHEIRDLREHLNDFTKDNTAQHVTIGESLMDIRGVIRGATWVHRLIWGFTTLFLIGLASILGWQSSQIYSIDSRTRSDAARVDQRDVNLAGEISHLRDELRILEATVHTFQRSHTSSAAHRYELNYPKEDNFAPTILPRPANAPVSPTKK